MPKTNKCERVDVDTEERLIRYLKELTSKLRATKDRLAIAEQKAAREAEDEPVAIVGMASPGELTPHRLYGSWSATVLTPLVPSPTIGAGT